jgi:hypothetical protein
MPETPRLEGRIVRGYRNPPAGASGPSESMRDCLTGPVPALAEGLAKLHMAREKGEANS